jgi:diketogulonate reductase-like aldo/keto reductase
MHWYHPQRSRFTYRPLGRRGVSVRTRPFGPENTQVPLIGQGTWEMQHDPTASAEALRRGIELGMTHIDTAEMYGSGAAEKIVGRAIKDRRDEVFIVSKVWPRNASRNGTVEACERSLERIGTDYLDVYLLHWPGKEHPLEETIAGFKQLQADGKIRHFGVSNFDVGLLEKAIGLAGAGQIACNQVKYHLKDRAIEDELIPFCEDNQVAVVGYSPFGHRDFPVRNKALKEVAEKHRATAYQVALSFLTRLDGTFAIPKASDVEHVESNAAADSLGLDDDDLEKLDVAFPVRNQRRLFR